MGWYLFISYCGAYFFEGSVNGQKYLELLKNFLGELQNSSHFVGKDIILQQNSAPSHYSRMVREFVDKKFLGCVGRRGNVE